MKVQLVIFDMDGLMFDTESVSLEGWCKTLKEMGEEPDKALYITGMGGRGSQLFDLYKNHYGHDIDLEALFTKTRQYLRDTIESMGVGVKPGVKELIAYLKHKNIKTAIASSSSHEAIHFNLENAGIENNFDYIMSGRDVEHTKPNPEIFLRVCRHLAVPVEDAVVLEDSINGVLAAHNAHIKCIMIPDLVAPDEDLRAKTYQVLPSLFDVINYI